MTTSAGASAPKRRERLIRMWWAAPGALVAGTAVGAAIVVGPTLGEHVTVPRELVVPAAAPAATPAVAAAAAAPALKHVHVTRAQHVQPTPVTPKWSPTPAPAVQVRSTHVVAPRRPVVTASAEDDGHESGGGGSTTGGEREGGDG